ncbi:hypothetical protein HDU67_002298 [Dinochytrium kinnereticum]|nr:hypothetical protein HDU67_002298 [Dinochytrium kinnereticum]
MPSSTAPTASSRQRIDVYPELSTLSVKFLGMAFTFTLSDPIPIPGTEPQEYRTAVWLTSPAGVKSLANVSLPLTFGSLMPYDPDFYEKKVKEYRRGVFRKVAWSLAMLTLLIVPIAGIIWFTKNSPFKYEYPRFITTDIPVPIRLPVWNKHLSVSRAYGNSKSHAGMAFFDHYPTEYKDSAFTQSLEVASSYSSSASTEMSDLSSNYIDMSFDMKPVKGFSLILFTNPKDPQVNITDYLMTTNSTTYRHHVNTDYNLFNVVYSVRWATVICFFGTITFFLLAALHGLISIWCYDISPLDRYKGFRGWVSGRRTVNDDERAPMLGEDEAEGEDFEDRVTGGSSGPIREGDI